MTYFQTKLRPADFIVTELLPFEPEGRGDYHYILLEKKGMTTFLFLDLFLEHFGLNKNMVGYAGLKDKHAITRQWFTISRVDALKKCGGINEILKWMRNKGKVITATYGLKMLKLGDNAGNHFQLVLVGQEAPDTERKALTKSTLLDISTQGVANYFGEQRFGHNGNNWMVGRELLAGTMRTIIGDKNTPQEKRFKVQAYASYVFNKYLEAREKEGTLLTVLPGDILNEAGIPCGPIPGDDLPPATKDADAFEQKIFTQLGLTKEIMGAFAKFGLYGIRRPIRIIPQQMTHVWHGKALHLTFDLPSGAYATVVIEALEKVIAEDEKRRASVRGRDLAMKAGEKPLKQERKRITDPVALAKKARELQEKYAPKNVAPLPPESIIPGRTDGHKTHSAKKGIEKKPVTDSSKRPAKKINPYTGQPMREKTKKSGSRASSVGPRAKFAKVAKAKATVKK